MEVPLPFVFFARLSPSIEKEGDDFKVNLVLDKAFTSLLELFADINPNGFGKKSTLTFLLNDESPVSLKVSQDSMKIRVQGRAFSHLWTIMRELVKRL